MRIKSRKLHYWLTLHFVFGVTVAWAQRGSVEIARDGEARAVIVAPADWKAKAELPPGLPPNQGGGVLMYRRTTYQESIKDLAHYLGRISGTEIEIIEQAPERGDRRTPIYVGSAAEAVFGPVGISKGGLFGFRVVAHRRRGVGLYGESELGTSYAIYELLHRLGCRWYMPSALGEVVPETAHLTVAVMDEKRAPATEVRGKWQGGADFLRRNRMGRIGNNLVWLSEGDGSFERFFDRADVEANPDWRARNADGSLHHNMLRLTHPGVADYVARKIIAQLDNVYEPLRQAGLRPAYQLTPHDGQVPTDDPFEMPHDPDPRVWEPSAGRWSVTDRCVLMITRVAEQVRAKYPDVHFGDYAYVNKSYPPARYPVPDDFQIIIAPIDFNRFHPMDWPDHPNEYWLRDMVQGWGKAGAELGAYWYGINLAEVSAPCPFITKWGTDLRILLENNLQYWTPETMNGWDSMMPGYYLAARMTFYPHETPEQILNDLWTNFYGAAAEPMARYWLGIDQAYLEAREYAGSPYGYLKIFTPEVMAAARTAINEALSLSRTEMETARVKLIDESFGLFEQYMQMRVDWAAGNVVGLETAYDTWRTGVLDMVKRYNDKYRTGDAVQGRYGNPRFSDQMYSRGYRDGARMEREYVRLGQPMMTWKWKHNPGTDADALPWTAPEFDDAEWPTQHIVRDTWSSIGHHFTMTDASAGISGRMAYRTSQTLPAAPAGKKVFLWIGSTDGRATVYVNGRLMPFREDQVAFNGYSQAGQIEITAALKEGENHFTILAERHHLNELGTGGLIGPIVLYREK